MDASHLQDTPVESSEDFIQYQPIWLVWGLLGLGVLLILFAESLGTSLATYPAGQGGTFINAEQAKSYILKIYLLGGMSFLAGLVERVLLEISSLRKR